MVMIKIMEFKITLNFHFTYIGKDDGEYFANLRYVVTLQWNVAFANIYIFHVSDLTFICLE